MTLKRASFYCHIEPRWVDVRFLIVHVIPPKFRLYFCEVLIAKAGANNVGSNRIWDSERTPWTANGFELYDQHQCESIMFADLKKSRRTRRERHAGANKSIGGSSGNTLIQPTILSFVVFNPLCPNFWVKVVVQISMKDSWSNWDCRKRSAYQGSSTNH